MRRAAPLATALLAAWALAAPGAAQEPPPAAPAPEATPWPDLGVAAIEITGATRFEKEMVWRTLGVTPGGRLRRDPAGLGPLLEAHYHTVGYAAARAEVRFDQATSTLHVEVDEGRVAQVELPGVPSSERERVLAILKQPQGRPFDDEALAAGLRSLLDVTSGAYEPEGDPPYTLERVAEGVRVTLRLRRHAGRLSVGLGGTGRAAIINRVDGFAPGVGAEALVFAPSALDPVELYAQATYGFSADRLSYALGARRRLGPLALGYEHHDFTDTDDNFRALGVEHPPGWYNFFSVFQDYYRRQGDEAYIFLRASPRLHLGVGYRADRYRSLPVVSDGTFLINRDPPPNPPVAEGPSRSLLFTARWTWKSRLFDGWGQERASFLVRDAYGTPFRRAQVARVEASFETADADALGGAFTYRRFAGRANGAARLGRRHWLLGSMTVGLGSDLPPQRRFAVGGQGTLRGRPYKELEGDRMVAASAEWLFEPDGRWPALVLFYDGGLAWSGEGARPPWRHDAGVGLAWPPGDSRILRLDAGLPLNETGGDRTLRLTGYIRVPF